MRWGWMGSSARLMPFSFVCCVLCVAVAAHVEGVSWWQRSIGVGHCPKHKHPHTHTLHTYTYTHTPSHTSKERGTEGSKPINGYREEEGEGKQTERQLPPSLTHSPTPPFPLHTESTRPPNRTKFHLNPPFPAAALALLPSPPLFLLIYTSKLYLPFTTPH